LKTEIAGRLVLVVVSLLLGLFVLELGARLWRGPALLLDWRNFVVADRVPKKEKQGLVADRELGFVGRPDFIEPPHSNDAQGLRSMPPPPVSAAGKPPLLATGDSYTYGAEVGDSETWPALLQALVGRRVVNAGVPGYGLDQIVLRSEQLAASLRPAVLVVSFIAHDVQRSEMSRLWWREKPYFEATGSTLTLRNRPVPASPPPGSALPLWERLFGWSILADMVRSRLVHDQQEWFGDHARALPRGAGERLACPLMKRLAGLEIPTLVVAQYAPGVWQDRSHGAEERRVSQLVLGCAAAAGLVPLDLFEPIDRIVRAQGLGALYGERSLHHNAAGNRLAAQLIAAELERRKMLP
jgi:hypothetical protein